MSHRARLSLTALAALSTLAGCGNLHPGAAVVAGDQTISISQADDYTRDVCRVIQSDPRSKGTYPMEAIRRGVVRSLALRGVAEQLAEQYAVQPGSAYNQQVKLYERNIVNVSDTERAHAVEVLTVTDYVQDIVKAVGRKELGNSVDDSSAAAKGEEILTQWTLDHSVEFDPRFDLAMTDKGIESASSEVSTAVSDFATKAAAEQPDEAFVASLPPSQRCG